MSSATVVQVGSPPVPDPSNPVLASSSTAVAHTNPQPNNNGTRTSSTAAPTAATMGATFWAFPGTLFGALKARCAAEWAAYTHHEFVASAAAGTLRPECFRAYLQQDHIYLLHMARAYALAAFKSADLGEVAAALATAKEIVDVELPLHQGYCADWGVVPGADRERLETTAYTRFILDTGTRGDILDLHAALLPCVVGYAEIAAGLSPSSSHGKLESGDCGCCGGNMYAKWINTYAGSRYCDLAQDAVVNFDKLAKSRGVVVDGDGLCSSPRFNSLLEIFRTSTLLEASFWDMALKN
ncbi:TenA family protein [Pelomyxa schiedti]|nr:TenA family protein [Pelomyxa schiedti]